MKRFQTFVLMGVTMLSATAASAQILPLSFEGRGELAFPTGDFAEGDALENGVGFGVSAMFKPIPLLGIYGGYERHSFAISDDAGIGNIDADIVDSGFSVGAQLSLPLAMLTGVSPWVKGGAIFHTLELDINDEDLDGTGLQTESERSTGFEVGAGLDIPLGMVLSFTPGVIYRTYSPEAEGGNTQEDNNVSHVSVGLGLRFRL